MFYVHRDESDCISSISKIKDNFHQEELPEGHPEILIFLEGPDSKKEATKFIRSDLQMIRVLDDLIDLLISKHVITFTDLPLIAQEKILERQNLRDRLSGLLSSEDDTIEL